MCGDLTPHFITIIREKARKLSAAVIHRRQISINRLFLSHQLFLQGLPRTIILLSSDINCRDISEATPLGATVRGAEMKNREKVTTDQELFFFLTFFYKNISMAELSCRQKQSLIKSTRVGGDKAVQGAALKLGEKCKQSEKSGSATTAVS